MKLHESTVLNNIDKFQCNKNSNVRDGLMRDREGIYLVWKTIEYHQPKSILEIGFGCGETLGIMIEAAGENCTRVVSNDITYKNKKTQFDQLFPENQIEFIEMSSRDLQLNEKFDFIMIDGDHSYQGVCYDINSCVPLLHKNGILCIDDYWWPEIDRSIQDTLINPQSEFVPFLCAHQQIFFHHRDHSVEDFLDQWLIEIDSRFINYTPRDYHGYSIVNGHLHDIMYVENNQIFQLALKYENL